MLPTKALKVVDDLVRGLALIVTYDEYLGTKQITPYLMCDLLPIDSPAVPHFSSPNSFLFITDLQVVGSSWQRNSAPIRNFTAKINFMYSIKKNKVHVDMS